MLNRPSLYLHKPRWQRLPGMHFLTRLQWDSWLFVLLCLMLTLSFVLIYSASSQKVSALVKQGMHVLLSLGVFITIAQFSPRTFKQWTPILYTLGIVLLLAVFFFGSASKGAQRWIHLPGFRFQPSELMKLFLPLMLAYYLDSQKLPLSKMSILVSLIIILVPGLMIAKQPDLGTGLLVIATGFGVLFFAGLRWGWIIKMFLLVLSALPLVWWKLHDYQRARVLTFLDPEHDPLGSGYHIIQSKIAIGSGGFFGKGWCQGTQAQLNFLPERTTDFVFGVLGEEFGFFGVMLLFLLYFAIIYHGMMIMTRTHNTFNRLLVGGIIFSFFICFFINIGMVSGLLPVVGCPLPLMSYGGTSLVTWMVAFGMLVAIQSHEKIKTGN